MRKSFFCSIITSFTVVGSVVGAGFISGKEILEFFAFDFSILSMYFCFICFFVCGYLVMSIRSYDVGVKVVGVVVSIASIIISGCMISALDEVFTKLFCLSKKVKLFSVLSAIFIFFTSLNGVSGVEKFNIIFIPIVVVSVIILTISKTEILHINTIPNSVKGGIMPIIYVGFNLLLSFSVIKNSGVRLTPLFKLISCFIFSIILTALIFLIANLLCGKDFIGAMPFPSLFIENKKLLIFIDIITLFAIFSTLFSSLYTAIDFGGICLKFKYKLLILLFALSVSEIGFSKIVEYIYPILGILGFLLIGIIYLLRVFFRQRQRAHTFLPLKRKG